ncbi:MAG TPA: MFS transporter [Bryobacteraceae bacterium]|jgi:ACS family hexuronate transporter-like MFS transporter|nr:MFS transporter [Bryobacteraceae bacterium]
MQEAVPMTAPGVRRWQTGWIFLGLAFLATVINYLDRQTLSVIAPVLRTQLHFGDVDYSRIVSAFLLAYTIANAVSGWLIDRTGTKWGYAICMLWWSAASALHVFARSAASLGVCRFLLGIGEAGNWPAAVKVVSEWFPVKDRALASGIFNSGSSIGALLAPPLVAAITLRFGWRSAFLSIGLLGFIWAAIWLRTYRMPPVAIATLTTPQAKRPSFGLIRDRFVWSLLLAKIFFDPAWYFYIFWIPQYLSSARHFDLAEIGLVAWIPYLAADIGNLAGGAFYIALLRLRISLPAARKISLVTFAALMTAAIPAVLATTSSVSIAFVSVATFGYTGCLANMLALPGDFYPSEVLGSIWGLASTGAGFGGMLFSLITGWAIARFSYVPVFFGFGVMPLVSAAILLTITTRCASKAAAIEREVRS